MESGAEEDLVKPKAISRNLTSLSLVAIAATSRSPFPTSLYFLTRGRAGSLVPALLAFWLSSPAFFYEYFSQTSALLLLFACCTGQAIKLKLDSKSQVLDTTLKAHYSSMQLHKINRLMPHFTGQKG